MLNRRAKAEEEFDNLVGVVSSAIREAKQYHQVTGIKVHPHINGIEGIYRLVVSRVLFILTNYLRSIMTVRQWEYRPLNKGTVDIPLFLSHKGEI